uniref:Uncharacterized protein n=1 Tax=Tanacetum cinerariifolium TaxID=118510 RepID=A0A699JKW6_TANCI|nr:hypothetical protein [Tanacetum cinerariifolium]
MANVVVFASRSNLVRLSYRPVVATSSHFLSTSSSILDCYNLSIGFPCYSASIDLFYKACDSHGKENSEGLEEGDIKMYMTLSLKSMKYRREAKDVIITKTRDLLQKLKEEEDYDEDDDWSMRLKDGVMNVSIPKLKNKAGVPNKFELKFL